MTKNHLSVLAGAMAFAVPLLAMAQSSAGDPGQANHAVPALRYDSAFADYKPWQETQPADWRAVNDAVRGAAQGGGHAGHGASAQAASAPPPAASGHAGHGDSK